jgi:hypothetical protein
LAALADQPRELHAPKLFAPRFTALPSGLIVPSSVADRVATEPPEIWVPAELRTPAQPVAVVDRLPMSADQFAGAINEDELGLPSSTLPQLIALVSTLPFERCFLLVSRLLAKLDDIRDDAHAQLEVVRSWDMPGAAEVLEKIVRRHEAEGGRIVVFAEQYLTVLQRLLVEHAADLTMVYEPTDRDLMRLIAAIFASATVTSAADADLQQGDVTAERWLLFTVKNGLYNAKPPLVNEITRSREMFAVLAPQLVEHEAFVPIDDWFIDDYGLTAKEQAVAGEALSALSQAFNDEIEISERSLFGAPQWRGDLETKSTEIEALLSAERTAYAAAFSKYGDDLNIVAWERRPFLAKPFLRFTDGTWLLISPRAIASWLGEGFIHRLFASAERRGEQKKASIFLGELFERYCVDLARAAYPGVRPPGGGRVYEELPYETRFGRQFTNDIAIDLGSDLVLIEIVSARLPARVQVTNDPVLLEQKLETMLFKKLGQLGRVSQAVLAGTAAIPDVDPTHIKRIWPVLVTGGELMQTELLWDRIDERLPERLKAARIAAVSVFDIGDFELLLALVAAGNSLTDILLRKASGPYRQLEIARFARDELHTEPTLRLPVIEERFQAQWRETLETLAFAGEDEQS